jgi:transposase
MAPHPYRGTGFLDAARLVRSQERYGGDLLGPACLDDHWQARAGSGFDAQYCQIDEDRQHSICPAGKTSTGWTPAIDQWGNPVIKVTCSTKDRRRCDQIAHCSRSTKGDPRRTLSSRLQPYDRALQAARQQEATDAFPAAYARHAGSEGTISRGIRCTCLRQTHYLGLWRGSALGPS